MKHTPWKREGRQILADGDWGYPPVIAQLTIASGCFTWPEAYTHGDLIVRAVNNHAKLLAALEECYRVLAGGSYHAAPATAQARAVIEEAKK